MAIPRFTHTQILVLAILTLINFVNYIDRQIIFALVPLIQADFGLTHLQVAWLGTVFSFVHSLFTLPLAVLADRTSRKKIIGYGVILWSAATFLSGLAASFRSLLTVRALVGVGEAAYAPAATATITGSFSRQIRARVQGVFDLGMFIGGAAGLALGSILGEWVGWRPAFFIVAVPGLLLALSILRLPEPPVERREKFIPIRQLLRVPAYVMVLVGGWFITFAAYSYIFWGTKFVHEYKAFRLRDAGLILGGTLVVAGILGVLAGAALADRLAQRFPWGRVAVIGIGFLVSAPFLFWAFHTPSKGVFLILFFVGGFFATWYHGPLTATIHDLTPARAHATAIGVYYFFVNFFATTWAFPIIGRVADRHNLLTGMHVAWGAQVVGALCFFVVAYLIRRHGLHHPALAHYH